MYNKLRDKILRSRQKTLQFQLLGVNELPFLNCPVAIARDRDESVKRETFSRSFGTISALDGTGKDTGQKNNILGGTRRVERESCREKET